MYPEVLLRKCISADINIFSSVLLIVHALCLIQLLLPNHQPHLPMAYPVSTDEALMPESQRDNCYISVGGKAHTESVQRLLR
jgi:hypothetical protein